MRRIIINTCLEYVKSSEFKKNSQTIHKDFMEDEKHMVVYNEVQKNIDAHELVAMLQWLPPVTRAVFNLFAFEGYNHNEIAALLGISINTSAWHVHNARSILQKKIILKKQAI
jgi:RNA polymerase sigma-70 factor (ECF subfamily)